MSDETPNPYPHLFVILYAPDGHPIEVPAYTWTQSLIGSIPLEDIHHLIRNLYSGFVCESCRNAEKLVVQYRWFVDQRPDSSTQGDLVPMGCCSHHRSAAKLVFPPPTPGARATQLDDK